MFQKQMQVLDNRRIGPGYYRLTLRCGGGYDYARPGQFVMLRISGRHSPLLRRPFSIHRLIRSGGQTDGIAILYRVVGETTRQMSALARDGAVDVIGPLGRGFSLPSGCRKVFIAGGGIGVAPLLFLADYLLENRLAPGDVAVFIGGRSRGDLLCGDDFQHLGMTVALTTDDGSAGDRCLITDPLHQAVRTSPPDLVCACGPPAMLDCVAGIAEATGTPCQLSVEAMMACGMGACLGCAVESLRDAEKYLHVCKDGPVFEAHQLKWNFH